MASTTAHSWPSPTCIIIKGTVSKEGFDLHLQGLHHGALMALTHLKQSNGFKDSLRRGFCFHGLYHSALMALAHLHHH